MRIKFLLLYAVMVLILIPTKSGLAAPLDQNQPVVKVVLFWTPGCPSCLEVLQEFLPNVITDYGNKLEIRFIRLVTTQEIDRFYSVTSQAGLPKEKVGLPLIFVGGQALIGSTAIPQSFASIIDQALASGGVEYPVWLDFSQFVWTGKFSDVQAALALPPESEETPKSSGMTLAAVTLVGLLLVLAVIIANMVRGFQGKPPLYSVKWSQSLIPILAILGLGVAIYLSYVEITAVPAICGPVGDCNTVQQSQYARILGVLPVGLAGVVGYLAILAAWIWGKLRKDQFAEFVPTALFGMTVFGTLYSIYLTYLEIYVIHAVCIWCITSAVVMGVLALVCTPDAVNWIAGMEDES